MDTPKLLKQNTVALPLGEEGPIVQQWEVRACNVG